MNDIKLSSQKTGDVGECAFLLAAIQRGFVVSKPFGNSRDYDFILDTGVSLFRVQVKAANNPKANETHNNPAPTYGSNRFGALVDVHVCYNITDDTFYLIPASEIPQDKIKIGVNSRKYDKYKENWSVFSLDCK